MLMYRYEDGDAEHLQWPELKEILLALPANEDAEDSATQAVTTKANKRVAATGGIVQIPVIATQAEWNQLQRAHPHMCLCCV